jgi:hypothetical protein
MSMPFDTTNLTMIERINIMLNYGTCDQCGNRFNYVPTTTWECLTGGDILTEEGLREAVTQGTCEYCFENM